MAEQIVQLPVDSTSNKNQFRVVAVLPAEVVAEYTANGFAPIQEVVVLADDRGNIVGVAGGESLKTADENMLELLRAVCLRLDCIAGLIDRSYKAPDRLAEAH